MRKHFAWYLKGLPGAAKVRSQLNLVRTYHQVEDCLQAFLQQPPQLAGTPAEPAPDY